MSTHETAQQRYRRLKADKLRHSQIAVSYTVAPVRCATCNHSEIIHPAGGRCGNYRCDCQSYQEA